MNVDPQHSNVGENVQMVPVLWENRHRIIVTILDYVVARTGILWYFSKMIRHVLQD